MRHIKGLQIVELIERSAAFSSLLGNQARSYGVTWEGKFHPRAKWCQLFATLGVFLQVNSIVALSL